MEKSEQPHNFDLPPKLRWRSRDKNLKCMNVVNPTYEMHVVDDDESSNSREFDSIHAVENLPEGVDGLPGGGSDDHPQGRLLSPPVQTVTDDTVIKAVSKVKDEISATREKLMIKYHKDIGNLKERIRKNESIAPIKFPFEGEACSPLVNSKSKLKSAITAPSLPAALSPPPTIEGSSSAEAVDQRSGNKSTRPRRNLDRPKLSTALTAEEIEEDFFAMTGKKPPGKPKRRPINVQTRLNGLFPGSGLSEFHPDRYKVNENTKN